MQGNNIGDEGARYISDALRTNTSITNINLAVLHSLSLSLSLSLSINDEYWSISMIGTSTNTLSYLPLIDSID